MKDRDLKQVELTLFKKYLREMLKPILGALPANFDLTNKTQEEVEEAQGWMNPWRWYVNHGYSYPDNPAPSVRVFANLFVKRHLYSKSPDDDYWLERDPSEHASAIQVIEKLETLETLEIMPFYGLLCCVIREWVPYQGNEVYKTDIRDDLESNDHWKKMVCDWPVYWRSIMDMENGGITESEDDIFVNQNGPCKIKNPFTGKITKYQRDIAYYGRYGSVLRQMQMELACRGLPWDEKTTLYTLWRSLGGSSEKAPKKILPERGGWVETFVISNGAKLRDKNIIKMHDLGKQIRLSDLGNQQFTDETVIMPSPYQETISSGAWLRDSSWDKQAGEVKSKHQKWIDAIIAKQGFALPKNIHQKTGSLPVKGGTGKRGRPRTDYKRWTWYEETLGSPSEIRLTDIKKQAMSEYASASEGLEANEEGSVSKTISDIKMWLRTSVKVKIIDD